MIALGVAGIPFYARVVRSTTLAARELVYVRAARAVGMSDARIMLRHILPNIVSPILIMATLGLGGAILAAAGLSFLGLGAERPSPEWGLELSSSRHLLRSSWWISTFNGLAIAITVLSINLLGDGSARGARSASGGVVPLSTPSSLPVTGKTCACFTRVV